MATKREFVMAADRTKDSFTQTVRICRDCKLDYIHCTLPGMQVERTCKLCGRLLSVSTAMMTERVVLEHPDGSPR
jgi:hypothetical protein